MRRLLFPARIALVLALVTAFRIAAAEKWIHLRTDHFEAISDASEKAARSRLEVLERYRSVLTNGLFGGEVSGMPTRVLLLKSGDMVNRLVGDPAKKTVKVDGGYRAGFADNQIVVDLADDQRARNRVSQHEFIHLLTRNELDSWPLWLVEGMATCFEDVDISSSKVTFGRPMECAVFWLKRTSRLPWRELFGLDRQRYYSLPKSKAELVYPQSWLLTHYLLFGLRPTESLNLDRLFRAFDAGADSETAFQRAFGWSVDELESRITTYLDGGKFHHREALLPKGPSIAATVTPAPAGMASAWMALWQAEAGRPEAAEILAAESRKAGGDTAWACMADGWIRMARKDEMGARDGFRRAVGLDPDMIQARVCFALSLLPEIGEPGREQALEARGHLRKAVEMSPEHATAWGLLGQAEHAAGESRQAAIDAYTKALNLNPRDHHSRFAAAILLAQVGLADVARSNLKTVIAGSRSPKLVEMARKVLESLPAAGNP